MTTNATSNSASSLEGNTYRSATTGARVWRRELLSRRRDEFADLPDGIRSVYVARVARSLSGLFLALGGALIVALSASPELSAWLQSIAPGPRPAVVTTLLGITWGLGALFYLGGWALAENRFTRAMLRAVKPTEDLHHDVQRLSNVHPGAVAVSMTRAWETASTTLPVLAVATLLPATLVYLAMAWSAGGFVELSAYEAALESGSQWLAATAGLGVIAALVIRRLRRTNRASLNASRNALRAALLVSAVGVAAGLFGGWSLLSTLAGSFAAVAALASWAAGRIRKDRMIIDTEDAEDTADLRTTLRSLRTSLRRTRELIRERGAVGALSTGIRSARARLMLGRRLLNFIKAPLSWSPGTVASVTAAGLIIAFTGWMGADALASAQTDADTPVAGQVAISNIPGQDILPHVTPPAGPPVGPQHKPDAPSAPILYTAPSAGPGMAGTLLIIDLKAGRFASTDLDIDLQYLPCGKIRKDAGWKVGSIEQLDGQLALAEDYAPGEPDALDITSTGASAPMELRNAAGIVFTPCMVAPDLDMNALDDLAD